MVDPQDPEYAAWNLTEEMTYLNNTVDDIAATLADEEAEWQLFVNKKANAGVLCGPKELIPDPVPLSFVVADEVVLADTHLLE